MRRSRTENVSINMVAGLVCQFVNLVLSFVSRTFFIRLLGAEYLGVNGLFSNVLSILSFAELGIGNAIVFSMYKPLAIGDTEKLGSLMTLYKKAYRAIGITIAAVGICVTPFLNFVIKETPDIPENLSVLYLLFLFNTVFSYFFAYKRSIITADQKNYIMLALSEGINIARSVAQIALLYFTHNYIIYLLVQIACGVIDNLIAAVIADKMYPFLKQKALPLSKDESKKIFRNVRALAMYKFGSVILNGTDNILVSAMVGVREVGLVSNYVLLHGSCKMILSKITEAFTASVGNFNAVSDNEQKYEIFNKLFFIVAWLYGFASVGLITVSPPLITAWIGSEYLLDRITVIAIVGEFYFQGVQYAAYTFRTTLGYFVQSRYVPILAAIANIVLSVLLCRWIGLAGIFMATSIARVFCMGIVDPLLIYKSTFHKSPFIYWAKYVGYLALFIVIGLICDFVVKCITISGWLGVMVQIFAVTIVFNTIMVLIFCRTNVFKGLLEYLRSLLRRVNP